MGRWALEERSERLSMKESEVGYKLRQHKGQLNTNNGVIERMKFVFFYMGL